MTEQEAKNIFRSYLPAKRRFDNAQVTIRRLHAELDGLKSLVITDMPHGTGMNNPIEEAYARFDECVQKFAKAINHYVETMERAESLLLLADDMYGQSIIQMRWFDDVGFDFIPAHLYMDRATMFRHYNKALSEIVEKSNSGINQTCD